MPRVRRSPRVPEEETQKNFIATMSEEGGNNGGGGGDDLSGLSGFFFYVFIVHPATAWILRPGRFERKKSIMYAIGFLALLAAVKTGMLLLILYMILFTRLLFGFLSVSAAISFSPFTHIICVQ